jgi:hypothetical protein
LFFVFSLPAKTAGRSADESVRKDTGITIDTSTRISYAIAICIRLIRIGNQIAIVTHITYTVTIQIALICVANVGTVIKYNIKS